MFSSILGNKGYLVARGRSKSGLHKQQECTWFLFYYQAAFSRGSGSPLSVLYFLPFHWLVRPFPLQGLGNCPRTSVHPGSRCSARDAEVFVAQRSLDPEVPTSAAFACKSTHLWLVPRCRFSTLAVHQNGFGSFKKCKSWDTPLELPIELAWGTACLKVLQSCPAGKVIGIKVRFGYRRQQQAI